jgi:hypothetical protein
MKNKIVYSFKSRRGRLEQAKELHLLPVEQQIWKNKRRDSEQNHPQTKCQPRQDFDFSGLL